MQAGAAFAQAHSQRQIVEEGEHYRILGLKQDASDKDIKAAFRQLARQYHPDVNKEDGAGDSFKSIRLAYEVLSNTANRTAYDESLRKKVRSVSKHRSREKSEYRNGYSGASRHEDKTSWSKGHCIRLSNTVFC
ncbi:hypothetical protein O6H91_11G084200 [Diphasiastrum complanatum]|uniref:Uncharacterized protein n=2 Tax=Diphasiastrum complanatum TaxID=34168 RepID=A0ACC2A7B4_DIPCM|nr:hypothetical protein O6H91_24G004800 [Diphasiastrum complanatum]KAJ7539265.1 hypothetical protein O6H91_11G084200 [Diphasiastrum complanatum]